MLYHNRIANTTMAMMLTHGTTIPLGIKAPVFNAMMAREKPPAEAQVLSRKASLTEATLVADHKDLAGYQFDWRMIVEKESSRDNVNIVRFDVIPEKVLARFPHPKILDRVIYRMYWSHPDCNERLQYDTGDHCLSVFGFSADEASHVDELRIWIASVFLPVVMLDLIETIDELLTLRQTAPAAFDVACEVWANGDLAAGDMILLD